MGSRYVYARPRAANSVHLRSDTHSLRARYAVLSATAVPVPVERPRDAVAILQPALRGAIDASNLYVTRTELHELLAQAWDAAGNLDSAAVHYAWIAKAWRAADPALAPRLNAARTRLAALKH